MREAGEPHNLAHEAGARRAGAVDEICEEALGGSGAPPPFATLPLRTLLPYQRTPYRTYPVCDP